MNKTFVTRAYLPPFEEYVEEIRDIWDSHWLTNMGDKHNALEDKLSEYLKVDNISLFSNGHMALELLIQAFGLTGEVITTPFTFISTTHAIVRNGLTPVFCDIDPVSYTIDASKIEELITDKTSAIIPVHVYGNICDVEAIEGIARRHGLKVIYDAAHGFGVEYKGRGIGSYGDASMFSFHATKVYNTIEGGAVAYTDEEIGRRLYNLKNFGIRNEEEVEAVGANAKLNEFSAAMGLCNLKHVGEEIDKRKRIAELYNAKLDGVKGIRHLVIPEGVKSNYAYYPIMIDAEVYGKTRDEIFDALAGRGIHTRKYFYPITTDYECYSDIYDSSRTPVAKRIADGILCLPIYGDLSNDIVSEICDVII